MSHEHGECRKLLGSLSDFVDGDLEAQICAEIERHLVDCDNCRIVVDSLRKTVYLYKTTTEPAAVPEDVRERLFRCLDLDEFIKGK